MQTTSLKLTKNRALFGTNTATLLALCALALSVSAGCGDVEAYEALGSAEAGIVDGRPASFGETYSTVALIDIEYGPFCTGTLVTPNVVLTAAHCVQSEQGILRPEYIEVVAGSLDVRAPSPNDRRTVTHVVPHEGFDGNTMVHDIALLILAEAVNGVPIASTSTIEFFDETVLPGTFLTISGYGLQHQDDQLVGLLNIAETPFWERRQYDFFAGGQGESDTCQGDSGGPVYLATFEGMLVVGITSYGIPHETIRCGAGGVYTFVPAYFDWINNTLNNLGSSDPNPQPPQPNPNPQPNPDPNPQPDPKVPQPGPSDPAPAPSPESSFRQSTGGAGCSVGGEMPADGFATLLLLGFLYTRRHRTRRERA